MARYRPIYVDIWESKRFIAYDPRQRDVFFFMCTNKGCTESGIYKINPPAVWKFFHDFDGEEGFRSTLKSIADNVLYDERTETVFVIEFLAHNGLKHGNPKILAKSIFKDYTQTWDSKLWTNFKVRYPNFATMIDQKITNKLSTHEEKVEQSSITPSSFSSSASSSPEILTLTHTPVNFKDGAPAPAKVYHLTNSKKRQGGKEEDRRGGYKGGEEGRGKGGIPCSSVTEGQTLGLFRGLWPEACAGFWSELDRYLEFKLNKKQPLTTESVTVLIEDLKINSSGSSEEAGRILRFNIASGFASMVYPSRGKADEKQESVIIRPAAMDRIRAAAAASSLGSLERAVEEFNADRVANDSAETIAAVHADDFVRWLKDYFSPSAGSGTFNDPTTATTLAPYFVGSEGELTTIANLAPWLTSEQVLSIIGTTRVPDIGKEKAIRDAVISMVNAAVMGSSTEKPEVSL